jgi:hypothetical protein
MVQIGASNDNILQYLELTNKTAINPSDNSFMTCNQGEVSLNDSHLVLLPKDAYAAHDKVMNRKSSKFKNLARESV